MVKPAITGSDVWQQLTKAGLTCYFQMFTVESKSVSADADIAIVKVLQAHPSFQEGLFHGLHADVGANRTDFRAFRKAFGFGSLQVVVDRTTGRLYADIDKWSPYADVVGFVGHAGEVIKNFFGRRA